MFIYGGKHTNKRIINLLEDIKNDNYLGCEEYLNNDDKDTLSCWYKKYSEKNCEKDFEEIINLLSTLYFYENIDIYPAEEYHKEVEQISNKFSIKTSHFLEMLAEFRKIVYGF